MQLNYDILM